jgi:hypothetical protein
MAVPVSRPRTVSMTGVTGWWSLITRSTCGMVSVGRNPQRSRGTVEATQLITDEATNEYESAEG